MTGQRQEPTERPKHRPVRRRAPAPRVPNTTEDTGPAAVPTVLRLQAAAGNAAVSALIAGGRPQVQRREAGPIPPPPVPPAPPVPAEHPGFQAVSKKIGTAAKTVRKHPSARSEADAAHKAAKAPPDDKEAQAKAAKADQMNATKPGTFDRAGFIAAVNQAIAAQAPKNLDEADKFASSGKSDAIASTVMGKVSKGKEDSAKPMAEASNATPDTSKAVEKPVTPVPEKKPVQAPPVGAAAAMPPKAPAEQTNLAAGPAEADQQMAEAGVTEEQLAKSNEPEFTGAVEAKKQGEEHSKNAPAAFRESEAAKLEAAKADAQGAGATATSAMTGARAKSLQQVAGAQAGTKSKDETERAKVTAHIKSIFDKTKTDVDKILGDLDGLVSKQFEEGEKKAKEAFTADHKTRMEKYKDDRYSGALGWARWLDDKWSGLPAEANEIYQTSKKLYESKMQVLIGEIADTVGRELTRAKERVAAGRLEIEKYVAERPKNLQKFAKEAAADIGGQFDDLDAAINDKSQALAEDLAGKYVEARNAVDEEIKAMQEANKGLWDSIKDAVGGAIKTILQLKDMLLGVLARAANAVSTIIKDPIGFLGKFVNAVKTGITNFVGNIATHLKKGLQGWLFGTLAEAGIEIPEKFDLKGIITLVLSLLGLTWNSLRARIVKHVGEPAMKAIEGAVDFVKAIMTEGIPGLWKWIAAKLSDLKEMVMTQIKDFVVTKIITAGITWLISLLNPAAAFIKACKMIYDAVMWFVDNASRLKDFVDSVLDSVESIAKGGVGAVAALIENTMSKMIPMLISGLASLLGLGGIADKIKKILEMVQRPVGKVVDKLVGTAVKYGKKLLTKLGRSSLGKAASKLRGKAKDLAASGKAWLKKKARQVGEALGIVKKPFQAGSESHTLSVDMKTGKIRMASSEGPVEAKVRHYVAIRNKKRADDGQPPLPVEPLVSSILARVRETTARILAAKSGKTAIAQAQLDGLAAAIADLLSKIGGTPTDKKADVPSGVGKIAPHGSQGSSNRDDPSPNRWLESEHIIPVRVISLLFEKLGEVLPIVRGTSEDTRQHTIMIYKGAATSKTRGAENADINLINQLKSLAAEGMARLEGRGMMARRLTGDLTPEERKELKERAVAKANQVRASLASKLPAIMAARVQTTVKNVEKDHSKDKHTDRGHTEALPTEEKIRSAATSQVLDVVEIFADRVSRAD